MIKKRYSIEHKKEAVRMLVIDGLSIGEVRVLL